MITPEILNPTQDNSDGGDKIPTLNSSNVFDDLVVSKKNDKKRK